MLPVTFNQFPGVAPQLLPGGPAGLSAAPGDTPESAPSAGSPPFLYSHTLQIFNISPCCQALPEPQPGGVWWYLISKQGPPSAAYFWHLVSLGESPLLIFPFLLYSMFCLFQASSALLSKMNTTPH